MFLKGNSITNICRILTKEKILIPSIYKNLNRGLKSTCYGEWTNRTITDILTNPTYIGNLTQGRLKKINYKSKKMIHTKKEDWIITKNTCPKIIDELVFNQVQKIFESNKYNNKKSVDILLKGIVRCRECNHTIGFRRQKIKDSYRIYGNCNYYIKHKTSKACTPHSIKYNYLEDIVIKEINNIIKNINRNNIINKLKDIDRKKNKIIEINKDINRLKKLIELNNNKLDKMYIDKIDGNIDDNMYNRIYNRITEENKIYKDKIDSINIDKIEKKEIDYNKLIDKYLIINRNLINNIIEKIYIDEDKNIEIYFKFNK